MTTAFYIDIDKDQNIRFPKTCVVCGRECYEQFEISGNPDVSYWGGWKYLFGNTIRLQIFTHKECYRKLKTSLKSRNFVLLGFAGLSFPLAYYLDLDRLVFILLVLLLLCPGIYWQIKNPPPIEFAKNDDLIEFTIKDELYAHEFARINNVSINYDNR